MQAGWRAGEPLRLGRTRVCARVCASRTGPKLCIHREALLQQAGSASQNRCLCQTGDRSPSADLKAFRHCKRLLWCPNQPGAARRRRQAAPGRPHGFL